MIVWPGPYWLLLHASGYVYKLQAREFTDEERTSIKTFLTLWCKYLKCNMCTGHCMDYATSKQAKIDEWKTTDEFWKYGVEFHNHVNVDTKKPEISMETAEQHLLDKILRQHQVTDPKKFSWLMEEFMHMTTMCTDMFSTFRQLTLQHDASKIPELMDEFMTFVKSLTFVMPFQFYERNGKTMRELWRETIESWDWKRIQDDPALVYSYWRELYNALYHPYDDLHVRLSSYFLREMLSNQKQQIEEANKTSEKMQTATTTTTIGGLSPQAIMFIVAHLVFLVMILVIIRVSTRRNEVEDLRLALPSQTGDP
jgi:hypothetical protein